MLGLLKKIKTAYYRRKQRLHQLYYLGKPTYISSSAYFAFHKNISIGRYCRIGRECHLDGEAGIEIEDGTILAPRVVILTSSHNYEQVHMLPYNEQDKKRPVKIGSGCWIGWGAFILPGVEIGDGAVVAMGSVVTKHVAPGEIVAGNPARVVRKRENTDFIREAVENEHFFIKHRIENQIVREGRVANVVDDLIL
jgi:maltose O-acetyltransferase